MPPTSVRRLIVLCLFIVIGSAGCTLTISPATPVPQPQDSANAVIFNAAQTTASLDAVGGNITGTWQPTPDDVAQLEADLPTFLMGAEHPWLRAEPPIWERAPRYKRQYLGIVEDGTRLIYANFFCTAGDESWRETFVFVMDGGDCYFQLKYNPQTHEFTAFSVNGES